MTAPAPPRTADEHPPPAEPRPTRRERFPDGLLWPVILPLLVVTAAGVIRFHALGSPERCYFDETYYYYDAREYLEFGTETSFAVHPPVGKWIIAAGLAAFGVEEGSPVDAAVQDDPGECVQRDGDAPNPAARTREAAEAFARRAMSAIVGTGSVALVYFIGLRLFRSRGLALMAAGLLAVEGLSVTMSRIAMLDIFLQFFVLLGVLALLVDRDRLWEGTPDHVPLDPPAEPPERDRTWLWLAGAFLGLAVATKWSALTVVGLGGGFALVSELAWRRRWTGRPTAGLVRGLSRGVLALVIVPVVVYVASYAGWFANFETTRKADRCEPTAAAPATADDVVAPPEVPGAEPSQPCAGLGAIWQRLDGWWEEQHEIYDFHANLQGDHPYRAEATTWPLMTRPVAYYYESCPEGQVTEACEVPEGQVAEVLGMGNPGIWWPALISYPVLLWFALRRRDPAALVIALLLFGQTLPYLVLTRPVFLFYMTPATPFMVLSLVYAARRSLTSPLYNWVPAAVIVLTMAGFAYWAPLLLGVEVPRSTWDQLIWVRSWV